jgi:transcription termination/antitermination protein NusG
MGSVQPVRPWFAVQVAPRCEATVAGLLEYKGSQSFLPTYKSLRRWSDRTKTLHLPLFPGYVFCRSNGPVLGLVVSTPHVVRIVGLGGKPSPIDETEIDALQRVERSGTMSQPCPYLRVGERVQIKSGPLSGIVGILVQIRNESRLVISIDAIMKSVSVDATAVERYTVEPVAPEGLSQLSACA